MKRHKFASMVGKLLTWIDSKGWCAIIGDANRSRYEQNRYWKIGRDEKGNVIGKAVTACDGLINVSPHQYEDAQGRYAIDIMLHSGDGNIDKNELYVEGHAYWSSIGGEPMIPWDGNHWEVH